MKKIKSMFENLGKNIILSLLFIVIFLNFNLEDISKVLTGIVAICGLIIAYSYNNGIKNQREQQLLQIKKENYIKFIEVFLNRKIHFAKDIIISKKEGNEFISSKKVIEIDEIYYKEICKLNIYASKYVLQFIYCFNDFETINIMILEKYNINIWNRYNRRSCIDELTDITGKLHILKFKLLRFESLVNILSDNLYLKRDINNLKDDNKSNSIYYISMSEILSDEVLLMLIRQDLNNRQNNNLVDFVVYPNSMMIDNKIKYRK